MKVKVMCEGITVMGNDPDDLENELIAFEERSRSKHASPPTSVSFSFNFSTNPYSATLVLSYANEDSS